MSKADVFYRLRPLPLRMRRRVYRIARERALAYIDAMSLRCRHVGDFLFVPLGGAEFMWALNRRHHGASRLGRFLGVRQRRFSLPPPVEFNAEIAKMVEELLRRDA